MESRREHGQPILRTWQGGCHCRAVRFEFDASKTPLVHDCNCSMCRRTGYLHLIIPRERLRLLTPWQALATYTFNTGVAQHYFCRTCGIKSFYVPRSNPDCYSVNARCVADLDLSTLTIVPFDGQNWEQAIRKGAEGLVSD